jgi:hypothetical protein
VAGIRRPVCGAVLQLGDNPRSLQSAVRLLPLPHEVGTHSIRFDPHSRSQRLLFNCLELLSGISWSRAYCGDRRSDIDYLLAYANSERLPYRSEMGEKSSWTQAACV